MCRLYANIKSFYIRDFSVGGSHGWKGWLESVKGQGIWKMVSQFPKEMYLPQTHACTKPATPVPITPQTIPHRMRQLLTIMGIRRMYVCKADRELGALWDPAVGKSVKSPA